MSTLLNHPAFVDQLKDSPIVFVDGGARGDLPPPFNKVNADVILTVKFEPDDKAPIKKSKQEIVLNKGLWDETGKVTFHLANERSVSSVLPPDFRLVDQLFVKEKDIDARKTDKTVEVEVTTIDELIAEGHIPQVDFIKLDIHGSEYQAINGARACMGSSLLGVLAETWCWPIHKGQKTSAQFEALLNDFGIYLTETLRTGKVKRNTKFTAFDKHQLLKFDSLYFKDVVNLNGEGFDKIKAVKLIGLLDLFGHYGYAAQVAETFHTAKVIDDSLFDVVKSELKSRNNFKVKYLQKFIDLFEHHICSYS